MTWLESFLPGLMAVEHIHPLLVHFPIVLLFAAFVVQVLGHFSCHQKAWFAVTRYLLYSGTVLACITVITGFSAAEQLGHDRPGHELVHIHRNWMVAVTAGAIVVSCLAWIFRHHTSHPATFSVTATLFFLCIGLALGADRGALLVYGHGYGVTTTPGVANDTPHASETVPSDREGVLPDHGHNPNNHRH